MQRKTTRTLKFFKRSAPILVGAVALAAAVSPAAAATPLAEVDRSALAMIAVFGTLLLAIVIEVWRMTLSQQVVPSRRDDR